MYLITKNKIADYIKQYPEAKTPFLTWLKELPYWESNSNKNQPIGGMRTTFSGYGDYHIKYNFNPWLKTGYIVWLGTQEAKIEYERAELEKLKIKHPNLVTITVSFTIPATSRRSKKEAEGKIVDIKDVRLSNAPEISPFTVEGYVSTELDLTSKNEYENALNRAINIFEAKPGTPEFDELTLLLPLIRHYEASNIELPRLAILDVIKLKMEILGMIPSHLTFIIGSDEEADLFLAGKNTLPNKTLKAVWNLLCIRIPLNDQSLIK
jgi:antitoxin component HigA of HigAB toxin-antitoxin module